MLDTGAGTRPGASRRGGEASRFPEGPEEPISMRSRDCLSIFDEDCTVVGTDPDDGDDEDDDLGPGDTAPPLAVPLLGRARPLLPFVLLKVVSSVTPFVPPLGKLKLCC